MTLGIAQTLSIGTRLRAMLFLSASLIVWHREAQAKAEVMKDAKGRNYEATP